VGRSFANLHIKSGNLEKTIEALRELSEGHSEVLGVSNHEAQPIPIVMYVSKSNENWISVLHDYFVWGTVKKVGKRLSGIIQEPVMTAGYINEEIFELSVFESGEIKAEKIFCEEWTRDEYGLLEERLQDDYLRDELEIDEENFSRLISMTTPFQAVDQLEELLKLPLWSDSEWIPHEESLRDQFEEVEFRSKNTGTV
jgi:hypothetical protein